MWFALAALLLIFLVVLIVGIGIGYLLHWLLPGVELGVGILIGVVTAIGSVNFFLLASRALKLVEREQLLEEMISKAEIDEIELKPVRRWRKRKRDG
jgi:hypothetical protein